MKRQTNYQRLKQTASGAMRTIGKHPDYDKLRAAAARAVLIGDRLEAGLLLVEAANVEDRLKRPMIKAHKPNLGPYSADHPRFCIHCFLPDTEWVEGVACTPEK